MRNVFRSKGCAAELIESFDDILQHGRGYGWCTDKHEAFEYYKKRGLLYLLYRNGAHHPFAHAWIRGYSDVYEIKKRGNVGIKKDKLPAPLCEWFNNALDAELKKRPPRGAEFGLTQPEPDRVTPGYLVSLDRTYPGFAPAEPNHRPMFAERDRRYVEKMVGEMSHQIAREIEGEIATRLYAIANGAGHDRMITMSRQERPFETIIQVAVRALDKTFAVSATDREYFQQTRNRRIRYTASPHEIIPDE